MATLPEPLTRTDSFGLVDLSEAKSWRLSVWALEILRNTQICHLNSHLWRWVDFCMRTEMFYLDILSNYLVILMAIALIVLGMHDETYSWNCTCVADGHTQFAQFMTRCSFCNVAIGSELGCIFIPITDNPIQTFIRLVCVTVSISFWQAATSLNSIYMIESEQLFRSMWLLLLERLVEIINES